MANETFAHYYDQNFLSLGDYFEVHRERFLASWRFLETAGLTHSETVLDVGGVGPLSAYMRDAFRSAVSETKCDLRGDLPFETGSFDLVICTETIEHIKDQESSRIEDLESFNFSGVNSMLLELHRVCRPAGHVLVTTPNANSYVTLHKWLSGEALMMDPNHVREFSVNDLRHQCEQAGFQVQRLETQDTWRKTFGEAVDALAKAVTVLAVGGEHVERGDNIFALLRR